MWGEDATKPTKYFPDFSLGGSAPSLSEAIKELISRLQANPPVHINEARKSTLANKKDKTLPAGVYGPTERERTKVRRGKKVLVKEWSYDAAALKMDSKTGKTRSLIRHFTWTGGPRSSARAVKLKTATEWREAKFKEYTEACAQWDVIRNKRRLAETRNALAELSKKEAR